LEEALRIQQKKHAKVNKWKLERFREASLENNKKESKSHQASFDRTKKYLELNKFKRAKFVQQFLFAGIFHLAHGQAKDFLVSAHGGKRSLDRLGIGLDEVQIHEVQKLKMQS
jgi:hypothetical protein